MLLKEAGPVRDMAGLDEGTPLFAQIAERLAEERRGVVPPQEALCGGSRRGSG